MPWTEEQKRVGRVELQRRRTTETAKSRRAAFLRTIFAATGAFFLLLIWSWSTVHGSTIRIRIESAFLAIITTMLLLLVSAGAYVRFLDWHRGAKSDGVKPALSKSS